MGKECRFPGSKGGLFPYFLAIALCGLQHMQLINIEEKGLFNQLAKLALLALLALYIHFK